MWGIASSAARALRAQLDCHTARCCCFIWARGLRDKESARLSTLLSGDIKKHASRLAHGQPTSRARFRSNGAFTVHAFMGLRGGNGASGDGKTQK